MIQERMGDKQDDDAPLDFSLKRSSATPPVREEEERPGPLMRSPELGQTAVPPPPPRRPSHDETTTIEIKSEEGESESSDAAFPTGYPPVASLLPSLAAMQGMIANSPVPIVNTAALEAKNKHQPPQQHHSKNAMTRPFKAYPKDPLSLPLGYFGLPGMNPFPGMDATTPPQNPEEMYKQYRDYVLKMQQEQKLAGGLPLDKSPPLHKDSHNNSKLTSSPSNVSSTSSSNGSLPTSPAAVPPPVVPVGSPSSSTVSTTTGGAKRKRSAGGGSSGGVVPGFPDNQKDEAYWERRRKNNDAAKRSRDARRAKEDEIAIRAAFLEQENLKLRVEVASLKNETAKLRCMLYNS